MASIDQTKKALQVAATPKDLRLLINEAAMELGRALPEHMRAERLVRIATTCIRQTPKLANSTPESFLGALFTAAQIGIEPIGGRAYLLPFLNSKKNERGGWDKVMEAQFVMGYKGLVELFYRHDKAVQLDWGVVREGDEFDFEGGSNAFLKHKPKLGNKNKPIAYWVQARLLNGGKPFKAMSFDDCMQHGRDHSKTWVTKEWVNGKMQEVPGHFAASSPWATDPDSMCLKTVLIQLMKLLPLSVEISRAVEQDEASREYRHGMRDMLDAPSTTNWNEPQIETPVPAPTPALPKPSEPFEGPPTSMYTGEEIPFGD